MTKILCPTCKKLVEYSTKNQYRPFCSERCKLIDLGAWADDGYSIQGEHFVNPDMLDDPFDSDDTNN